MLTGVDRVLDRQLGSARERHSSIGIHQGTRSGSGVRGVVRCLDWPSRSSM